jgi:flagellar basal body-associated protein FliL
MAAAPLKPKDPKPKTDETGAADASAANAAGALDKKFIITLLMIIFTNVFCMAGAIYFLGPLVIVPAITKNIPKGAEGDAHAAEGDAAAAEGGDAHAEAPPEKPSLGLNFPMEEFTVNLKAPHGTNQFARVSMALSVLVPKEEDCSVKHEPAAGEKPAEGGHGGGHGEAPPAAAAPGDDPCMKGFTAKMTPFLPTIRDIINGAMMKRSADDLSTPDGQEAFKDDVKQQVNQVIANNHYQVQRVNFEDLIIQR